MQAFDIIENIDTEINTQLKEEPSRIVRICMLKYKCIIIFILLAFTIFLSIISISDALIIKYMFHYLNLTNIPDTSISRCQNLT